MALLLRAVEATGTQNRQANWSGRRAGGFMSWPAVPGRPRRMAAWSDDRRRVAPRGDETLKRSATVASIQFTPPTTDSEISLIYNS